MISVLGQQLRAILASSRSFCTAQGSSEQTKLKSALRSLYKLVHPDLFHDHPKEKEDNERSFKLLQEYLAQAREGDGHTPAARVPYNFIFHVRSPASTDTSADTDSQPTSTASDSGSADDEAPPLQRVAVTLPPPTRAPGPIPRLSPAVFAAINRLLKACGVDATVPEYQHGGDGTPTRLLWYLPDALEAARKAEVAGVSAAVRIANIRGAMRLVRQVLVRLDKNVGADRQLEQLQRLALILERLQSLDLQGCTLGLLSGHTLLDGSGVLWLSQHDSDDTWVDFLTQTSGTPGSFLETWPR